MFRLVIHIVELRPSEFVRPTTARADGGDETRSTVAAIQEILRLSGADVIQSDNVVIIDKICKIN